MNILIVGNVIKDVYLNFGADLFEIDNKKTPWIEVGLDNEALHFQSRESIFSGAVITEEVLRRFRLIPEISRYKNYKEDEDRGDDYRYVIKVQNKTKYLTSKNIHYSVFVEPETEPEWIYIDRSANLNTETSQKILQYLEEAPNVKLAFFMRGSLFSTLNERVNLEPERSLQQLLKKADLVFASGEIGSDMLAKYSNVYQITTEGIYTNSIAETIHLKRNKFLTHLSIYSIAAATIFAGLVSGWKEDRALKLAKFNVENAKIGKTLSIDQLSGKLRQYLECERNMRFTAKSLVADKKGILAIDESAVSIRKKMRKFHLSDSKENCWKYRNLLITTPKIKRYLNGIILSSETAEQKTIYGQKFVDFLTSQGIISGIKVDLGLEKRGNSKNKYYTLGLDGLSERLDSYYKQGFRFTKWRAVFYVDTISKETKKTEGLIDSAKKITDADDLNIACLVKYTKQAIENRLIPVLEPEVINQSDEITPYYQKTKSILRVLFERLCEFGVDLNKCILKMNMIYSAKTPSFENGRVTVQLINEIVPKEIGGIVFLSGGQSPEQATENLAQIIEQNHSKYRISFSFGRAIQDPVLELWNGKTDNISIAKKKLHEKLAENQQALRGL